jgi:transketolase
LRNAPYSVELKPYGRALFELAKEREDVLCLSGDLTRQCEIDLFQEALPGRFIHCGMAEANMMSMAGALARQGFIPFVHTFGVFATRRPFDQIINSIAYPKLPVRIVGFMPGVSTPGGPSHQAIEDVALMRCVPGMTVIDVSDAQEIRDVVRAIVDVKGPVYLRLKRGEVPVIFDSEHRFRLDIADVIEPAGEVVIVSSGMMLPAALQATDVLRKSGVSCGLVHVPVIKPLDVHTLAPIIQKARIVISTENHNVIGGLGSAVAEMMAEHGFSARLVRIGIRDTYAEGSLNAPYLFKKYGLTTQHIVDAAWSALGRSGETPVVPQTVTTPGEYAPV